MRCAILYGPGDVRLADLPEPRIHRSTDAMVAVEAAGICGSDLWRYRGERPTPPGSPLGHEVIGTVIDVGPDVLEVRRGDRVIVPFCHADGSCAQCQAGYPSFCDSLAFTVGGQGEAVRVAHADATLVTVPHDADDSLNADYLALTDVMPTGWHAATAAEVGPGSDVVVVGDGAVGLCAVLACAIKGASDIVVMSRNPARQASAWKLGATHVIEERGDAAVQLVLDRTKGAGAAHVLECVGTGNSMQTAVRISRAGAHLGYVGLPQESLSLTDPFARNLHVAGGRAPVRRYLPQLLSLVVDQQINPGMVFDLRLGLNQTAEGYRAMHRRDAVKVMVTP